MLYSILNYCVHIRIHNNAKNRTHQLTMGLFKTIYKSKNTGIYQTIESKQKLSETEKSKRTYQAFYSSHKKN